MPQQSLSQMGAVLDLGIDTLSANQTICFQKYIRVVLPLDGFVFWVNANLLSISAIIAATGAPNYAVISAPSFQAPGSLHYATDVRQSEDETLAANHVIFTSENPVQDLNYVSPSLMYLGNFDGRRFAFSSRGPFYQQANLYHYRGDAVYPALASQIVDTAAALANVEIVVSNSLPLWLALDPSNPPYPYYTRGTKVALYPSFAVPDNLAPPYAAVHIPPESTRSLQTTAVIDSEGSAWLLAAEKVRITFYGLRNSDVMDFLAFANQYSVDTDLFGVMNMPLIRDEKRTQAEMRVLAMKKTIEFEISYYQNRIRDVALQLILACIPTYQIGA
jgi:hypothetical protein